MRFRKKEEKIFALKTLAKLLAKNEALNLLDIYSTFGTRIMVLIDFVEDNREAFDETEYLNLLSFLRKNRDIASIYSSSPALTEDNLHIKYQMMDTETGEIIYEATDEDVIAVYEKLLNNGIKPTTENMYQALKRYVNNGEEGIFEFHRDIMHDISELRRKNRRNNI